MFRVNLFVREFRSVSGCDRLFGCLVFDLTIVGFRADVVASTGRANCVT